MMPEPLSFDRRGFFKSAAVLAAAWSFPRLALAQSAASASREMSADVLIIGGSFGGVSAALAAASRGFKIILTEETAWIGGQATTQGVPLDEHPWVEDYGCTASYRTFRRKVREYYRANYPLSAAARADPHLNPGAGWVSALCFEPRVGMAVLYEMLAPYLSSGQIVIRLKHRPIGVHMAGDRVEAVTLADDENGRELTLSAPFVIDATELGELLELGNIERKIGAESRAETGEPLALDGPSNRMDQMAPTHVFALDYLPGEEHVIDRPKTYDHWLGLKGKNGKSQLEIPNLFGEGVDYFGRPESAERYQTSVWNFRRLLCRRNFSDGAFPSDISTAVWGQNEFHSGVFCGVPLEERARQMAAARELSLSVIYWLQTEAPHPSGNGKGYPGLRPRGDFMGTANGLAQYPYIRESVRLQAEFTILEQHFRTDLEPTKDGPVKYPDSVGVSGYRIDIHKASKSGGSLTQANHGKHWCQQIPLGALLPVRVENLLPASKNLGVTAVTNGAFRVHPTEWNIGESSGALAAFCLKRKVAPRQVRATPALLADFQSDLKRTGVDLDWPSNRTARSYYSQHDVELKDADRYYFGEAWRL